MPEYISNAEYRKQKAALTRAINSGEPRRVIIACERVVEAWRGKAWPDDWHRWNIALGDACFALQRQGFDCSVIGLEDLR
jgi:hypothetical protein